jgi:hypothetical protein
MGRPLCVAAALAAVAFAASAAAAQGENAAPVRVQEIAPGFHLLTQGADNLVLFAGEGATLVVGVQTPALAGGARALAGRLGAAPIRWAVMMESDSAAAYADGGWGRLGAQTLAHEMLHVRMERLARARADSGRAAPPLNPLPGASFSAVVQLYIGPEELHLVHPRAGYTDADLIAHWEEAGLVYLGNTFTNDGYPLIDYSRKGSLAGMIATVEFFVTNFAAKPAKVEPIVPGRGPVATLADLKAYHDMLVMVRDRLAALLSAGKTVEQAVAARPTADLDARWGHGPVSPDRFVAAVYGAMARARSTTAPAPAAPAAGHDHGAPTPAAAPPARPAAVAGSAPSPSGSGHH